MTGQVSSYSIYKFLSYHLSVTIASYVASYVVKLKHKHEGVHALYASSWPCDSLSLNFDQGCYD